MAGPGFRFPPSGARQARQEDPLREQIAHLVQLQGIDDEAGTVRARLAVCANRLKDLEGKLADLSGRIETQDAERRQILARQKELTYKIEDANRLSKKAEKRLMEIKTSREYRALQRELEDAKGSIKEMEDEVMAGMERVEELDKSIAALAQEHGELTQLYLQEKEDVDAEVADKSGRLEKLVASRMEIAGQVTPSLFQRYERIAGALSGRAVAAVVSMVCRGCNMNIPPQAYNELQRGDDLKFCPHCERIIYWKQDNGGEE